MMEIGLTWLKKLQIKDIVFIRGNKVFDYLCFFIEEIVIKRMRTFLFKVFSF